MTCLYHGDKISDYMVAHGVSRTVAKSKFRKVIQKERVRNDVPVRGAAIRGTGKGGKAKKK